MNGVKKFFLLVGGLAAIGLLAVASYVVYIIWIIATTGFGH